MHWSVDSERHFRTASTSAFRPWHADPPPNLYGECVHRVICYTTYETAAAYFRLMIDVLDVEQDQNKGISALL